MRRQPVVSKVAKNLYLEPDAIEHADKYAQLHRTNLSQLVSDFLRSLPLKSSSQTEYSPTLRRLIGSAVPREADIQPATVEDYREHLIDKYGRTE